MAFKANLVQNNNKRYTNKSQNYKAKNPNCKKNRDNCNVCGKPGHHAAQYRYRDRGEKANANPPKVNLTEGDEIIDVVIIK